MAGSAFDIHSGLAIALGTVPGLRVADHLPEQINPPVAVIQLQSVTYHRTMQGGVSEWSFVVALVAGRMGDRAAQVQLDDWIAYSGTQSIRAAIETDLTLNGKCQTLIVGDMVRISPVTLGDASYLSTEFNVTIHA
jgi:hypothetical protein